MTITLGGRFYDFMIDENLKIATYSNPIR